MEKTLKIEKLEVVFTPAEKKRFKILRGIDLEVGRNESLALAGESGSGKTITARSVMRLLPRSMHVERGAVYMNGKDIMSLPPGKLAEIRGSSAGMIFQEPSSYLNPVFTAGSQVAEAIKGRLACADRRETVMKMLAGVGLKESVYYQYPHQLSGGMQQRVMIAMALVNRPALLIADEPTTALDVTTAYGIIELLKELMSRFGLALLFITHDISLAANFAQKIAVMYAGRIVEISDAAGLFKEPLHPYTQKLISCLPERYRAGERIAAIEGSVPDFGSMPSGCAFHPRCPHKNRQCTRAEPGETRVGAAKVRCFRYGNAVESE